MIECALNESFNRKLSSELIFPFTVLTYTDVKLSTKEIKKNRDFSLIWSLNNFGTIKRTGLHVGIGRLGFYQLTIFLSAENCLTVKLDHMFPPV